MKNDLSKELCATILAMSMFALLNDQEGVAVHLNGKGYMIFMSDGMLTIDEDPDMLKLDDRSKLWVHPDKETADNAKEEEEEARKDGRLPPNGLIH